MAFQTGLLAAAMAAIILETTGTRVSDLASLSIARAFIASASPWEIFWIACRQPSKRKLIIFLQCSIPLLAFLVNLTTTFTSTILLSDFDNRPITTPNTTRSIAIGFKTADVIADFSGMSYWQARPAAHWRFAETRPPASDKTSAPKDGADTGDIYRALLPFESVDNRTSLAYYSGPTIVTNLRTKCVAPAFINATLSFEHLDIPALEGLYLTAQLSPPATWEGGPKLNGSEPIDTKCRINNEWDSSVSTAWPLSICSLPELSYVPAEEGFHNPLSGRPYAFHPVILLNSSDILNGLASSWNESIDDWDASSFKVPKSVQMSKATRNGPWTSAITNNGSEAFKASICFVTRNEPFLYNVTMSGKAGSSEPSSPTNLKGIDFNKASSLIKQLGVGVSPLDFDARGILNLDIHSGPRSLGDPKDEGDGYAGLYTIIETILFDSSSVGGWTFNNDVLEGYVDARLAWPAHPEHSNLVQAILHQTSNPAEAIQGLFFRLYQMIFFDLLPLYTKDQPTVLVSAKQALIPTQCTGLIIILSVVVVHLILVLIVNIAFAMSTGLSMLGNSWQAVCQTLSPKTTFVVQAVSDKSMRDNDVHNWTKSTVYGKQTYGLSTSIDNDGSRMWKR